MSKESDSAVECFMNRFNCSQAVFSSHCEKYGINKEYAYKIGSAFGGGMGHLGEICGAVAGAMMLIGLKYGKYKKDDMDSNNITYKNVKEFTEAFKAKHGSIKCTDLIGFNLSNDDELSKANGSGVFRKICPELVRDAVEIVEKYL
jgi:C_GCAxxG_C_C family probable redox protein